MRLLTGAGLLVETIGLAVVAASPPVIGPLGGEAARPVLSNIAAICFGVSLTATLAWLFLRTQIDPIVEAAERLAGGDLDVNIPSGRVGVGRRLSSAVAGVSTALAETHAAATIDKLTGVWNRQALLAELFSEVERASRYDRPFTVAFVDIDHFKQVNDTYGHHVGDVVLRRVAQSVRANIRANDIVGRYGGEEFMVLLAETDVEDATVLAEKIRNLIQGEQFNVDGNTGIAVTVSIGIAGGVGKQLRVDELIRDADAAMYSAKGLGRNQTYVFAEPDDDARVPRAPISTTGRSRAQEIGRVARDATQSALTAFISPLPHYRGQPSALIATIVVELATKLSLPEPEIDRIRVAALLHDVGKVAVPEEILEKPGALTSAEWRSVVQHPRIGQVILEQATALRDAVPIILHHHERFSGHGYPYGLRGTEIPLGARIVAIADAYDAMTHDRPYKQAISHEAALRELRRHAGTQFDPDIVQLFCDVYGHAAPQAVATSTLIASFESAHHPPLSALAAHESAPAATRGRRRRSGPGPEAVAG